MPFNNRPKSKHSISKPSSHQNGQEKSYQISKPVPPETPPNNNQSYQPEPTNGVSNKVSYFPETPSSGFPITNNYPPQPAADTVAEPQTNGYQSADVLPSQADLIAEEVEKSKKKVFILPQDNWLARRGHTLTFILLYLFTLVLYFRPYELFPALSWMTSVAATLAIATLLVYLPLQFTTEGTITARPPEIISVIIMAFLGFVLIPIAKNPALAWKTFNDPYIKVILIFIVMVNVLRTERRMKLLMGLALAIGATVSYWAMDAYWQGKFTVEDYRVGVDFGGMFGNPNDLSLHLVIIIPIAIGLGCGVKSYIWKIIYFGLAAWFVSANTVTFSRGGFLGLLASVLVLAWKLGRKQRLKVMAITSVVGIIFTSLAPGNFGLRLLSIFIPGLDPVGSADERREMLIQSIMVTIRNPWGIGIDNFRVVSDRELVTHNAYTQVSAEMGLIPFICYMVLLITPLYRLYIIERQLFEAKKTNWVYYLAIGLEASFAAYMVASFFNSSAYQWYLYYLVAYAICLRRIYELGERELAPI
jgi:O-antigen ligase